VGKVLVLVGVTAASVALVSTALANHSWGSYHWARKSNPLVLNVGDNVGDKWDAYLTEAITDWSASSVLELMKVPGGTRPKNCRATSGRIEACNARYGNTGWLGIAQIWASGSHIAQAITKVNDTYFDTASYNTPAWRRLVMCQEIAHDFGLGHQNESFSAPNLGSCMDYTNDPDGGGAFGPSNEHPNTHDFAQLELIYGHVDSTSTVASGPAALPGNAPPFSQASRANGDLYVDDLGNGVRRITHVFWTPFGE